MVSALISIRHESLTLTNIKFYFDLILSLPLQIIPDGATDTFHSNSNGELPSGNGDAFAYSSRINGSSYNNGVPMDVDKKTSYMSIQSSKLSYSKDSDTDHYYDERKSSAGRKTISEIVQMDPDKRVRRKRGVIAPHVPLDTTRSLSDLQYDKYEKDGR